ncbi:hypothetical protein IEO_03047 [Bacillus wiedmannii]|uniref:hypothetical protein n=1 Tax=Bacillus wiedmannii TaxID=1890302 RepID=UPI00027C007F|nr:hypothetical protein [Bacillus wiedmannii]EJV61752.1 hypothetical protein IEO_03047 [Bacillus wiedmannii]
MQQVQIYLGVPQTNKLQVYRVQQGQQVTIKQMVFRNSEETDVNVTVTINTIDVMTIPVKGGSTEFRDTFIVLNQNDTLLLQQNKENAVSATVSGTLEQIQVPVY